jgi:glutamine synthetase
VWHVFAIDQTGIAFTDDMGVVGDQRIRIDLTALRALGAGLAWAPGSFFNQDGSPVPACSRGTLARVEARVAQAGFDATVGHEIEFILVGPDGERLPPTMWAQYGAVGLLEHEGFVRDVIASAAASGVSIEQFHPEYGPNQFELSLTPLTPVAAADQLVLTRIIIGRVARRHGMRVSFSPVPFAGSVGSGAHQHFSLYSDGRPLFSGGTGAQGMTADGEHAIAGVLAGLPEAQGVLCGSIVSGLRMLPGYWAGAYACWGTENREAAVRFLIDGASNPYGANAEVKVIDPSANPYFATAAILGLALDGMEARTPLPPETTVDPASQSDGERARAGTVLLTTDQSRIINTFGASDRMRRILGDEAVDAVVAVRRHEHNNYAALDPVELTDKFRMAWSL